MNDKDDKNLNISTGRDFIYTITHGVGAVWLGLFIAIIVAIIVGGSIWNSNNQEQKNQQLHEANQRIFELEKKQENQEAVAKADCIMSDIWISMGEKDSTKKISLFKNFKINDNLMKQAKSNTLFMHCLPAHRGEEVTDSVIDGKNSIVWEQAKNRMFVQQSILNFCIA